MLWLALNIALWTAGILFICLLLFAVVAVFAMASVASKVDDERGYD